MMRLTVMGALALVACGGAVEVVESEPGELGGGGGGLEAGGSEARPAERDELRGDPIAVGGEGGSMPLDCGPCGVEVDGACEVADAGTLPVYPTPEHADELCPGLVCDGTGLDCPETCDAAGCVEGWSCDAAGYCLPE